jgi:hypothetical protein
MTINVQFASSQTLLRASGKPALGQPSTAPGLFEKIMLDQMLELKSIQCETILL